MAATNKPEGKEAEQKDEGAGSKDPNTPSTTLPGEGQEVKTAKQANTVGTSPQVHPRKSGNTTVTHAAVRATGFDPVGERRRVRVLRTSYLNGAVHEAGTITFWPEGVEELGPNLELYEG